MALAQCGKGSSSACPTAACDVIGKSLSFLQGPGTDKQEFARVMEAASAGRPVEGVELISYDLDRAPFVHVVWLRQIYSPDLGVEVLEVESKDVRRLEIGKARGAGEDGVDTRRAASRYGSIRGELRMPPLPRGEMTVITHGYAPYSVVWASPAWLDLCGFTANEVSTDPTPPEA